MSISDKHRILLIDLSTLEISPILLEKEDYFKMKEVNYYFFNIFPSVLKGLHKFVSTRRKRF